MINDGRNAFGRSSNTNPFVATAGAQARALEGVNPLGLLDGSLEGIGWNDALKTTAWVKTLDSGTVTPTVGQPSTLVLATAGTINTGPQIQESYDGGTTAFGRFKKTTGYSTWMRCRVKLSDASASSFFFGLASADTTIFDASSTIAGVDDAIGIYKVTGAAAWALIVRNGGTSTSQTLTGYNAANDTYQTFDIVWNPGTSVKVYVNNVLVYTQTTLTNETSDAMALSVALDAGANAVKTATIERMCAFIEKAAA